MDTSTHTQQKKKHAQEAIDEMDRHYDHNVCLDRFLNEIELQQHGVKDKGTSDEIHFSCSSISFSSGSSDAPRSSDETDTASRSKSSDSLKSGSFESDKNVEDNEIANELTIERNCKKDMSATVNVQLKDSSSSNMKCESSIIANSCIDTGGMLTSSVEQKGKNYKGGKLGRKRKRGYIYNPKPVTEKPPKSYVPVKAKDQSYWDKRKRNNEAARKSREMRRVKEQETINKQIHLKKANEALRMAITLLMERNKSLERIICDFEGNIPYQAATVMDA